MTETLNETLPISVSFQRIFAAGNPAAEKLQIKLEAWANFQALAANWFANEENIYQMAIVIAQTNDKSQSDEESARPNDYPYSLANDKFTLYWRKQTDNKRFNMLVALKPDAIEELMAEPSKVSAKLQHCLGTSLNLAAEQLSLNKIV